MDKAEIERIRKHYMGKICRHMQRHSGEMFPPPDGLGDVVSNMLSSVGITKERFSTLLNQVKREENGGCGCNRRQRVLNKLGSMLGLSSGKGGELQKILEVEEITPKKVYGCAIHGKCIHSYTCPSEQLRTIARNSMGIQFCEGCKDKDCS